MMHVAVASSNRIARRKCLPSAKTTKSWRYYLVYFLLWLLFIARNSSLI